MEDQKYRFRACLLYDFKQGKSVRESHTSILKVFGEAAYSEEACKKWFQRFREGDETLQNRGRGHPPPALNDDDLRDFFSKGIRDLQEKWRKTIAKNGEYLLD